MGNAPQAKIPPVGSGPTQAPTRFGRFELTERIGAGGMAEVFRAAVIGPEGFRREVVVKRVLPQLSAKTRFTQMFINEAKISALLTHPNIVQIFDFGESDGQYFIAMESVRGLTLREVLTKLRQQERVMPVVAAAEITRETLIALDYAHNLHNAEGKPLEIVHRDISPSNIMLADTGAVKVLDFGIARAADYMAEDEGKVVKGKIAYLAPEQISCTHIDARTDVFAVGCVLHEILTGRVMFRAQNDLQKKIDLLAQTSAPPSAWNTDVPPALDAIVARATAREPNARYASAADMLTDVENYLAAFRSSSRAVLRLVRSLQGRAHPEDTSERSLPSHTRTGSSQVSAGKGGQGKGGSKTGSHVGGKTGSPTPAPGISTSQSFRAEDPSSTMGRGEMMRAARTQRLGGAASAERGRYARDVWARRIRIGGMLLLGLCVLGGVVAGGRMLVGYIPRPHFGSAAQAPAPPPPAAFVLVTFQSTPAGARIIDGGGQSIGVTPATLPVSPSPVVVSFRFEKEGYLPATASTVPDGDKTLTVELKRADKSRKGGGKRNSKGAAPGAGAGAAPAPAAPAAQGAPAALPPGSAPDPTVPINAPNP